MRSNPLLVLLALLMIASSSSVLADDIDDATPSGATAATQPASPKPAAAPAPAPAITEPERITIQHVLIGFTGSVRGKNITRTQEEAKVLAGQILDRARKGEDFDALVKQYTDDSHPGIYAMTNHGTAPGQGEWARGRMVSAFGDAGFPLQVGEVGMAEYDAAKSPFGWHVVKRLK